MTTNPSSSFLTFQKLLETHRSQSTFLCFEEKNQKKQIKIRRNEKKGKKK